MNEMKKRAGFCVALFLLGVTLLIPWGEGRSLAPAEKWVARYNGPRNGYDGASAIAVDGSGNVYVTGISGYIYSEEEESAIAGDYVTIKYNINGIQLWVQRYDGPAKGMDWPSAVAVDGLGNVYVTGFSLGLGSDNDYTTIKYNTNGKQLWVKRYNGPGNGADNAFAVAVDGSGNVYVTGNSKGSDPYGDYATIKYNTNGKQLWVKRYNGLGNGDDSANAIALDGSGNVYVTGGSEYSGFNHDYVTIKFNTNGIQLWIARYNGPGNEWDYAHAIAVDGSGNVYVTGMSEGSDTGSDYATIKYNTNGLQLWSKRYNGPGNWWDAACAIAVDGSGNVCVTGSSLGLSTIYGNYDYATIKYNTNGLQLWVQRYDGPTKGEDWASEVAMDGSGNVYVTGSSYGDYATVKYGPNGKQLWVKRYDGPSKGDDGAAAIAVDKSGNVYVTGASYGSGTDSDYATVKY